MTIEWNDKFYYQKCYEFLFEEIKRYYLVHIFPNAFAANQTPLPHHAKQEQKTEHAHGSDPNEKKQLYLQCKEEIVKWLMNILVIDTDLSCGDDANSTGMFAINSTSSNSMVSNSDTLKPSTITTNPSVSTGQSRDDDYYYNDYDVFTLTSSNVSNTNSGSLTSDMSKHLVQKILLSNSINVNLIHEIIHQSFLLSFDDVFTVRKVLDAYRKWFLREALLPSFMQDSPNSINSNNTSSIQKTQELINKFIQQQPIPLGIC